MESAPPPPDESLKKKPLPNIKTKSVGAHGTLLYEVQRAKAKASFYLKAGENPGPRPKSPIETGHPVGTGLAKAAAVEVARAIKRKKDSILMEMIPKFLPLQRSKSSPAQPLIPLSSVIPSEAKRNRGIPHVIPTYHRHPHIPPSSPPLTSSPRRRGSIKI